MESCVDAEVWNACAGRMVKVPVVNSKVMYIPQGHAEHANGIVDFGNYPEIPAFVKCRVASVKYMANVEMDDVYLRMRLVPVRMEDDYMEFDGDDLVGCLSGCRVEKYSSFLKILTQSDANNGGGFSVPRHCAESFFPKLDYKADPPVQSLYIKDVHGVRWKFRHIFRGTPKRHLLTTGWSNFVNDKKLVAGDSVIFMKAGNGELCIGIRRAKRGVSIRKSKGGLWELPSPRVRCNSFGSKRGLMSIGRLRINGKLNANTVLETARRAAAGSEFEVDYYPQAGFPEFCVKSSLVSSALRIQWCAGMKFKMAFESEDASKDKWHVGTIQAVQAADPVRWPKSPWRVLQVMWDEPTLSDIVDRVSPWSVDISVGGILNMNPVPLPPPMKRLRLAQPPELALHSQHPPPFANQFIRNLPFYTGIQGTRHGQFGNYSSNLHLNIPPNPHLFPQFKLPFTAPMTSPIGVNFRGYKRNEVDMSHLWTSHITSKKNKEPGSNVIFLFGKRIDLEEKTSQSSSAETPVSNSIITSDRNMDKVKSGTGTESSESGSIQNGKKCSSDDGRSSAEVDMNPQTFGASLCNN